MKHIISRIVGLVAVAAATVSAVNLSAAEPGSIESVTRKDGKLLTTQGGQALPVEKNFTFAGEIEVTTNATYAVKGGKARELKDGQVLQNDGMLLSPDGSLTPVADHVVMRAGRPVLVKDGEGSPLTQELVLGDGTRVATDGTVTRNGQRKKMLDGQLIKLDGSVLPVKDTVVLMNGKVTLQKDGSSISLRPGQTMMMSEGTKVFSEGYLITRGGQRVPLVEGKIVTLEGVVTR